MIQKALNIFIFLGVIFILGCGEPNNPESIYNSGGYKIIAKHATIAAAQDVVVDGNYCHIAQGEGGLITINVTDPSNPINESFITEDVRGYSRAIVKYHNNVYLAAGSFGYTSVNVSDPANPTVSAYNINMKTAKEAYVVDNWMFAALSEQGIQVAELNEGGFPDIKGRTYVQGYSNGVVVNANMTMCFVATGEMGLSILDISDFQEGYGIYPTVGWINTSGYAQSIAIDETKQVVLIASGSAGLVIIDYADLTNLTVLGTFHTDDDAFDVKIDNGLAYVTAEDGGFYVVDYSDPKKPVSKAHLGASHALGFDFNDTHIFIADEEEGLIIIEKP